MQENNSVVREGQNKLAKGEIIRSDTNGDNKIDDAPCYEAITAENVDKKKQIGQASSKEKNTRSKTGGNKQAKILANSKISVPINDVFNYTIKTHSPSAVCLTHLI